jgi:excisionase family DNA binding protein
MTVILEREFLTPEEVAAVWRVSVATIYRRCADGRVPHIRVGGGNGPLRIPASAVVPDQTSPQLGDSPHGAPRTLLGGQPRRRPHGGEAA